MGLPNRYCPRCGEEMIIDKVITGADVDGFWSKEGYKCPSCGWDFVPGAQFVP